MKITFLTPERTPPRSGVPRSGFFFLLLPLSGPSAYLSCFSLSDIKCWQSSDYVGPSCSSHFLLSQQGLIYCPTLSITTRNPQRCTRIPIWLHTCNPASPRGRTSNASCLKAKLAVFAIRHKSSPHSHVALQPLHVASWTWGVISPMSLSSLLRIKPIASVLPFYLWNTPPASTPQPLSPSEPKATTRQPPRGFPASRLASPNLHMMGNSRGILNSKHSIRPTDNSAWPHQRH